MNNWHANDPDFDGYTEEELENILDHLEIEQLICKCSGDYCTC